ncbi:hypothetical protein [Nocardia alni]|uniref:hypothetical protein n=1 Tax=Nocardia alni TaxID=2815723 RepID=UPI001C22024C|nr:hypothetical protein [Nocardia alni]
MRDMAVGGLIHLLNRPAWRESDHGPDIHRIVNNALHDDSEVVRMVAARAARLVLADSTPPQRVRALGGLLLAETNTTVQTVLICRLAEELGSAPTEVDAVLERFASRDDRPDATSELGRAYVSTLSFLAVDQQTPFATRTIETWMRTAPTFADEAQFVAQCTREYLTPGEESTQSRVFKLLTQAADSAAERWGRHPEQLLATAELSEDERSELQGAAKIADTVAQQLFFASGAFQHQHKQGPPAGPNLTNFADLAFPILARCAVTWIPHSVHYVVETMKFLAPLDEKRALIAISDAINGNGAYAQDRIASDAVVPHLTHLLTHHRPLALHDHDGAAAFQHLLATFAAAGNEDALVLAYTFADVFR